MLQYDWGRDYVFNKNAKATVMKQTKGKYPAPLKIIEVSDLIPFSPKSQT